MTSELRCGFISILGLPNAGKSTLINQLVGAKISIVTHKPQTTRFRILGIRNVDKTQLIFIDTPGIFSPKKRLDHAMVSSVWKAYDDTDLTLFMIDVQKGLSPFVLELLEKLVKKPKQLIVLLNKVDLVKKEVLLEMSQKLSEMGCETIFMISALTGSGLSELLVYLENHAPLGPWHYPKDQQTDLNERLWAAEVTRETLFIKLHEELPYGLTVETTSFERFDNGDLKIDQTIYVERDAHRAIILGSKGTQIKEIGMIARKELSLLFKCSVHLFLHVKVDEKWQEKRSYYQELGLDFPKN
ncbi:MAG: GTPase Era [Proteobacteria bacterium]|nr:GTPase Era [Pseudomonadota bacterium]